MPHRDEVEVLAHAVDLLLESREPTDLMDRLLQHVAAALRAEAGFVACDRSAGLPEWCLLGIDLEEARRLADRLGRARTRERRSDRIVCCREPRWPSILAAGLGDDPRRPMWLALLSSGEDRFDPDADARLLEHIARHASRAIERIAIDQEIRHRAEHVAAEAEEVERARRALEIRGREIEHRMAIRNRFYASLSHELRTPINAIIGFTELLEEGLFGKLRPRQLEAVEKIASSATQLLTLINDTLDLAKLEAGKMTIRASRVELPTLVADAVSAIEVAVQNKGLELRVDYADPLPMIYTDPARVRQIILNLLSNAVKFTSEGYISLSVRHIREPGSVALGEAPDFVPGADGWITVVVEDTGKGIPSGQIQMIFGEFVQLPESDGEAEGSGLGLAIASRLARILGGGLTVESEVGVRSTFTLYLPCPSPVFTAVASET